MTADVQSGTEERKVGIKANENIGTGACSAYVKTFVQGLSLRIIDVFRKAGPEEYQEFCIFDLSGHLLNHSVYKINRIYGATAGCS